MDEADSGQWDNAIEYPDGSCVDNGGTCYKSLGLWLKKTEAAFNEDAEEKKEEESI